MVRINRLFSHWDSFLSFNGYKGLTNELINNELIGGVYTNLMYLKGFSQAAKTIYSHTTHVKNVAGGVQMSLANGINVFDYSLAVPDPYLYLI